jgi:hypothetical protein
MNKNTIKKLIENHAIGRKKPDAIIIDTEEKDHKIVFFKSPLKLDEVAIHDAMREKGKYYMKQMSEGGRTACYPIIVEMYEFKDKFSGDKKPTDIRIGDQKEIALQMALAFKKKGKWEYYEYKNLL